MDLDNIKKAWQESTPSPGISEEKIQQMLDNRGKSAFGSLIKYERWNLISLFICIPLSFVFIDRITIIVYLCSLFLGLIWQIYKFGFLRKINLAEMGILEISSRIATYKKFISREFIAGLIWAIPFLALWLARIAISKELFSLIINPTLVIAMFVVIYLIIATTVIVIAWALYKHMYINKIKIIEKSIQEIKEFEKDNNE